MKFKILFTLILVHLFFHIDGQMFLNHHKNYIIKYFDLDSKSYDDNDSTLSFKIDSINSGIIEFKIKDNYCYQYQFNFNCEGYYDCNIFSLAENFNSDWLQYNDTIFYHKTGQNGWYKNYETGEKKFSVPKMTLKYGSSNDFCAIAYISNDYIEKKDYDQFYKKRAKIQFQKRNFNGEWKITPNIAYPTTIETFRVNKKNVTIKFKDSYTREYRVKWISNNTCKLLYFDDEINDFKTYLICEIRECTKSKMELCFYSCCTKYYQTLTKK